MRHLRSLRVVPGVALAAVGVALLSTSFVFIANASGQTSQQPSVTQTNHVLDARSQQRASRNRQVALNESARAAMRVVAPMRSWKVSAKFGEGNSRWWNKHTGLDLRAKYGTRVKAVAAGKVVKTAYDRYYGRVVVVRGNGYDIWYGHLSSIAVQKGDVLHPGNAIGRVGTSGHVTGPHLHIEVRVHDFPTNPHTFLWGPTMGHPGEVPDWARQRITHLSDL